MVVQVSRKVSGSFPVGLMYEAGVCRFCALQALVTCGSSFLRELSAY